MIYQEIYTSAAMRSTPQKTNCRRAKSNPKVLIQAYNRDSPKRDWTNTVESNPKTVISWLVVSNLFFFSNIWE